LNDEGVYKKIYRASGILSMGYLAETARTSFTSRDFLREAVFFLMTPRLTALSIALYAAGKNSRTSFLAVAPSRTTFTASFNARRRRSL